MRIHHFIPAVSAFLIVSCLQLTALFGQPRAQTISPEISESNRVTFRLDAPKAESVEVVGQWPNGKLELKKNEMNIWEGVAENVPSGVWEYSLRVDGISMIDPGNSEIKPMRSPRSSILHLPSTPAALHDFQDVPHGTVHSHSYLSKVSGQIRRLAVYTPPDYESEPEKKLPMLILQHGSGDNEATWATHGKAHWIADNLLAANKAKPMIIVMLDGHIAPPADRGRNTEMFEQELLEQVLPFVESRYRVISSAEGRAIVGLSMGGGQSLSIGLKHTDKFAWVGGFSSAIPRSDSISGALDNAETTNKNLKLLWIGCGKEDFLLKANEDFIEQLKAKKIQHDWYLTEGNHSWPIWRGYLADILPRLF